MRKIENVNQKWTFLKNNGAIPTMVPQDWKSVNLPHTWNAMDGQDGGSDYYRGACWYVKEFSMAEAGKKVYLEFEAASAAATVYINGAKAAYHEGGYSAFRMEVSELMDKKSNVVAVCVDNRQKSNVYPQTADFTFYGGLYRDVNLITVEQSHFDLDYYGGPGLTAAAEVKGKDAVVSLKAFVTNSSDNQTVSFEIRDAKGNLAAQGIRPSAEAAAIELMIPDVHLWQGVEDPYLYQVTARLVVHNEVLDEVSTRIGVRTYSVDPQKGFFLNGKLMPLRGVSRHQDILGQGNALTKEQHYADIELIKEVGANTIRLAHYQHSQHFYNACDEAGMIVWAEIPFISVMNPDPTAHENCISQMKELIIQNYNHTSICFWGISNEITIGGERPGLIDNLKDLNNLVHKLDHTRLSTIAHVSMVPFDSEMHHITDVESYNHYFGWYGGEMTDNEVWLDKFHEAHPEIALGISEYGAEGIITYHSEEPKVKDYSEDYQAIYHEHMASIIEERPWLWSTHVWNMFDFGCDARDEGGVQGRNNKGLITLDRKIKKDAFYAYKAFWSNEPFVHLCGRRFAQRPGAETTIKVYSNQPEVTLWVNGEALKTILGEHIFVFEHVPMKEGFNYIVAKSGVLTDSMTIERTEAENLSYRAPEEEDDGIGEGAANWFNLDDYKEEIPLEFIEGYYSIKDTVGTIMENEEAAAMLLGIVQKLTKMKLKKSMLAMVEGMTIEGMMGMMKGQGAPENLPNIINDILNKIKK